MILVFLSAFLLVFSAQLFAINFSIQGLDRAIISAPIELFLKGVTIEGSEVSYNKTDLENTFNSYYQKVLPRYTKQYSVDYYYYNIDDGSMCITSNCEAVEITINCKLIVNYDYSRTMYYELRRVNNG